MSMDKDMFDPSSYRNVRLATLEAETLPPWCYTSRKFFDREVDRVFKTAWNFIGREDEVASAGDYMALELVGEPVAIVRGKDGKVRAFANTCRHRGTRMLQDRGNCRVISCPYHGWAYGLDGALVGTPGMEKTRNFDRADYGLVPLRLESWDGFLFLTFDGGSPDLKSYLGDLPEKLASHSLPDMVCVRRREYDLACNWKIYLENAMEEYHTPTVHKASIGKQATVREKSRGQWDGMHMPAAKTIALLPEDIDAAFPPIPSLRGKAAAGTYFIAIYPCTFFAVTQDCMWWHQEFPIAPNRTKVVIGSCFPRETVARSDFADRVTRYYRRWDKSLPEDNAISEAQQAGLSSSFSRPGRLSFHESVVHDIAKWVLDRVLDEARLVASKRVMER
ncbi:MAG TPA: aromatic ring-hydroxylating dioxygenase subunit alpha [Alphaproteobacteria bacterium]|nr:aromatic ring-hydroxylating dioxygenase subunit alpha [Alphaproteobacteria bacterium]